MPVYKPRRRARREEPLLDSNNEIQLVESEDDESDEEFQTHHDYEDHFLAGEESIPPLMKACITTHYNFDHPEDSVKYVEDFPVPKYLSPTQVLVRVVCASINPLDYKVMQGKFRLTGSFSPPGVLGRDASGIVVKLGSKAAKRFKIGDEVFGRKGKDDGNGTFSQYAVFDYRSLALIPDDLMFSEAAAIPTSGLSVFQSFETAKRKGASFDEVLIHGGSGGAGSIAILLAKHYYGAKRVYATTSTKNINYVKSLGADEVIDYTNEKFEEVIGNRIFSKNRHRKRPPLTLVFDTIGGYNIVDMSMRLMSPHGYYVQIAIPKEIDMNPSFTYYFEIVRFKLYVMFWRLKRWFSTAGPYYEWITTGSDGTQLYKVASILARHGLIKKLQIEKSLLVDMIESLTVSRSRRAVGKIVVQIPKKQPHVSQA